MNLIRSAESAMRATAAACFFGMDAPDKHRALSLMAASSDIKSWAMQATSSWRAFRPGV
jgi:hypothetical protein